MTPNQDLHGSALDRPLEALTVGLAASIAWQVDVTEIDQFAAISGDRNPLHIDAAHARAAGFADRVAHGMLLAGKLSGFIGMVLPGRRCLLLEQTLAFPAAVFPGDIVSLTGEIVEAWHEQAVVRLKIRATKAAAGKAVVVARGSVLCKILS